MTLSMPTPKATPDPKAASSAAAGASPAVSTRADSATSTKRRFLHTLLMAGSMILGFVAADLVSSANGDTNSVESKPNETELSAEKMIVAR